MLSVRLTPFCTSAIWGGNKLKERYGKKADIDIAETWELSGYPGYESTVTSGVYAGKNLNELVSVLGKGILGKKGENSDKFPLLIKFIDAAAPLSIQVHPNDEKAKQLGEYGGKTEMWIICEADPGAYIYFGVNKELSPELFASSIIDGSITDHLNKIYVKPGDTFFIKSGTIHAICEGITLCEIQQSSDVTYRLYDYKRKGKDGKERELHIEKGKVASELIPPSHFYEEGTPFGDGMKMVECEYFTTTVYTIDGEKKAFVNDESFASFTVTEGEGSLSTGEEKYSVKKGDTIMVFAGAGDVTLSGKTNVVCATL